MVPDPYGLLDPSLHIQGDKNNCTSHSFALMIEMQISNIFKERTLIDVDDLWEKQKKYGTATEGHGDFMEGPWFIASTRGVRYRTDSGKSGTLLFLNGNWVIIKDKSLIVSMMRIFKFFKKRSAKQNTPAVQISPAASAYKQDLESVYSETRRSLNNKSAFRAELEVEQDGLGAEIYESVKDVAGVQIDFHDKGKEDAEVRKVDERHQDLLKSKGHPASAALPYWDTFKVLEHGVVLSAQFLWPWIFKHVADDFDQGAWDAVKATIKRIVLGVLSKRKDVAKNDVVLKMHYPAHVRHGLAFIFPPDLNEEDIDHAFDTLKTAASTLPEPEQSGPSVTVLGYDKEAGEWQRVSAE